MPSAHTPRPAPETAVLVRDGFVLRRCRAPRRHPRRDRPRPTHDLGGALPLDEQQPHRLVPRLRRRARGLHRDRAQPARRHDRRGPAAGEERAGPDQVGRQPVRRLPGVHHRRDEDAGRARAPARQEITIHARGFAEVDAAVAASMDWIMHGNILTDETVAHLAESGTPLVPTLLLLANAGDWGHLVVVGAPVPLSNGMKEMLERSADALHRGYAAGVPMVLGTDSGFSLTPYVVGRCRGSAPSSTTRSPRSAAVRWRPPSYPRSPRGGCREQRERRVLVRVPALARGPRWPACGW